MLTQTLASKELDWREQGLSTSPCDPHGEDLLQGNEQAVVPAALLAPLALRRGARLAALLGHREQPLRDRRRLGTPLVVSTVVTATNLVMTTLLRVRRKPP